MRTGLLVFLLSQPCSPAQAPLPEPAREVESIGYWKDLDRVQAGIDKTMSGLDTPLAELAALKEKYPAQALDPQVRQRRSALHTEISRLRGDFDVRVGEYRRLQQSLQNKILMENVPKMLSKVSKDASLDRMDQERLRQHGAPEIASLTSYEFFARDQNLARSQAAWGRCETIVLEDTNAYDTAVLTLEADRMRKLLLAAGAVVVLIGALLFRRLSRLRIAGP